MLKSNERALLEKKLIASLFNSSYCIQQILSVRNENLFSNPVHQLVYNFVLKYYYEKSKPPESVTQIYEMMLLDDKKISPKLLAELGSAALTSDVIRIADKLIEDNLAHDVARIQKEAEDKKLSSYEYAIFLSEKINESLMSAEGYILHEQSNVELTENLLQKIKKNKDEGLAGDYIKTGIETLDKKIIGIPKGHITIIAARPGQGKSAFMLQLVRNVLDQEYRVGIISIEMEAESLLLRNLSAYSEIDSMKFENGTLTDDEFSKAVSASKKMVYDNYVVDSSSFQTSGTIKARIQNWRVQKKIDIIFIDYLTLISTNNKYKRFDLEIGQLTGELRRFAKDSGIPIVILSQLNRAVESRLSKKPMLSDLRESGSIEQDAKTVLFLHIPATYGINPFEDGVIYVDEKGNFLSDEEYLEIIVSKSRNGKIGTVPTKYVKKFHKITEAKVKGTLNFVNESVDEEFPI